MLYYYNYSSNPYNNGNYSNDDYKNNYNLYLDYAEPNHYPDPTPPEPNYPNNHEYGVATPHGYEGDDYASEHGITGEEQEIGEYELCYESRKITI